MVAGQIVDLLYLYSGGSTPSVPTKGRMAERLIASVLKTEGRLIPEFESQFFLKYTDSQGAEGAGLQNR